MTQFLERADRGDQPGDLEVFDDLHDGLWSGDRQAWEGLVANVLGIHGDVTPDELRNVQIRESFRGYHRNDVDALCERAAETIERLQRQRDLLEEQLRSRVARDGLRIQPRVVEPPAAAPAPESARELDVIQRTLLLAQRAADETLTEAQTRSLAMTSEAEAAARALVADAESSARRIADGERQRIEAEVVELAGRRDRLRVEVDALGRFSAEYRDDLRRAVEAELARLDASAVAEVERPTAALPSPTDPEPPPVLALEPERAVEPEPPLEPQPQP